MRQMMLSLVFSFLISITLSVSGFSQQSEYAGKYSCSMTRLGYSPVSGPAGPLLISVPAPSPLGYIYLDGKGNYKTAHGKIGRYTLNVNTGDFSFTSGELQGWPTKYENEQIILARTKDGSPKNSTHKCRLDSAKASTGGTQPNGPGKGHISGNPNSGFKGTVIFQDAQSDMIVEVELSTGKVASRFKGRDPWRAKNGETVYVNSNGVVSIADSNGVTSSTIEETDIDMAPKQPTLSPDSTKVAYYLYQGFGESYVIVRNRNGERISIFKDMANPTWTPDGRLVMVAVNRREGPKPGLFITDAQIKRYQRINLNLDDISMPTVSPDGQKVAFVYNGHIWVCNLDGTELKQITTSDKSEQWPVWSPDGQFLAVAGDGDVVIVKLVNIKTQTLVEMKNKNNREMQAAGRISWQ